MTSIARILAKEIEDGPVSRAIFDAAKFMFPKDDAIWLVFADRSIMIVAPGYLDVGEIYEEDWVEFIMAVVQELGRKATRHFIETKHPHLAGARHDVS
jgi:hypothetical protein